MLNGLRRVLTNLRLTRPAAYPDDDRIGFSGRTAAGVTVTPDNALQNAVVWACHRFLTQTVAQLPARVLQTQPDPKRPGRTMSKRVTTNTVDWVLGWRTNPELSPFQFKETMIGWAVLHGNGYAEIERDLAGRVVNLWPIHPDRVQVKRRVGDGALIYEVDNGYAGKTELEPQDVFHLRGFGNDVVGLSVIEYAAQSIGWAKATELFSSTYFANGTVFGGVVEASNLDEDGIKRARSQLESVHRGSRKAHKIAFLDRGMTFKQIARTPNESQFIETRYLQVEEVCRWFGVPPHKVMHLLRGTFSNIEHQSIEVVVDSITPWCLRFEEECTFKLFGQNRAGLYVKLDIKGLLRGDFKSRQEGLQIMRRNGIINGNDWADLEDMPLLGPDGEKYIVEGNMTTLEAVGQNSQMGHNGGPPLDPGPQADPAAAARLAALLARASALRARLHREP